MSTGHIYVHWIQWTNQMSSGHVPVHWVQWTTEMSIGHMHVQWIHWIQWTIGHTPFAISQACLPAWGRCPHMTSFEITYLLHNQVSSGRIPVHWIQWTNQMSSGHLYVHWIEWTTEMSNGHISSDWGPVPGPKITTAPKSTPGGPHILIFQRRIVSH